MMMVEKKLGWLLYKYLVYYIGCMEENFGTFKIHQKNEEKICPEINGLGVY